MNLMKWLKTPTTMKSLEMARELKYIEDKLCLEIWFLFLMEWRFLLIVFSINQSMWLLIRVRLLGKVWKLRKILLIGVWKEVWIRMVPVLTWSVVQVLLVDKVLWWPLLLVKKARPARTLSSSFPTKIKRITKHHLKKNWRTSELKSVISVLFLLL